MSLLQTTLITKAGYDSGFENHQELPSSGVVLSSARHSSRVQVASDEGVYRIQLLQAPANLPAELAREFGNPAVDNSFVCSSEQLYPFLQRTAALSRALPNQAVTDYQQSIANELEHLPDHLHDTEVERVVRQRIGQDRYRNALLDYWGGACSVTGIVLPELLRSSHAKPWADCANDAERLDVFNGFLLCAHLDALFDRFMISFNDNGKILLSDQLCKDSIATIGITEALHLRWLDAKHLPYLEWHRKQFEESNAALSGLEQ